ncbi:DUF4129 domain-containing protein [Vacuolonema iberomarrocanum]|uniref:DUF4129 domain-containing protein n=1 Tax=Vacuolonema iberomarrocanum TaxID=3454632 RepID=UPI0019DA8621|nr:DUF4129 domain-containing protein [filamentous cyanobacterium LEGE 07170]
MFINAFLIAQFQPTEFRQTGPGWVFGRASRNLGEWLQLTLFGNDQPLGDYLPDWQIPEWVYEVIFWAVAVLLISWASWQLYRLLAPYMAGLLGTRREFVSVGQVEDTPQTSVEEWVARSRRAQQAGDYREACRALYMAALQRLNDANLIRQQSSRTDGEYLSLLQSLPRSQAYALLVQTHEQLHFGDRPITAERYQQCQHAFQEISAS